MYLFPAFLGPYLLVSPSTKSTLCGPKFLSVKVWSWYGSSFFDSMNVDFRPKLYPKKFNMRIKYWEFCWTSCSPVLSNTLLMGERWRILGETEAIPRPKHDHLCRPGLGYLGIKKSVAKITTMDIPLQSYTHTHLYIYIYIMCMHTCMYIHIYIYNIYMYTYTYMCILIHCTSLYISLME